MNRPDLENKIFVGVVEDNQDPKKLGRVKARVLNVFDEIPTDDLPWAKPWKDLNGNQFNVPDKGKIVSVVFDSGNVYKPEYIFADHYNKNLEEKLQTLEGSNYTSMKALMFDHKTQIYSNDQEGLKLDYKMNNINIDKFGINLNIKDNFRKVNIGSPGANQQAILGNNFLNWFDELMQCFLANAFIDGSGSPVVPDPALVDIIQKYTLLRDPKFLSHHVNIVDNEYVKRQKRPANGQVGDAWKSTISTNEISSESVDFNPQSGNSTDNPPGALSPAIDANENVINPLPGDATVPPITPSSNPDVQKILDAMVKKGYKILTRPYEINIVGIRRQYEGQKYSNAFKDDLYAIYKTDTGDNWQIEKYKITTMPGFYYGSDAKDKDGNWIFKVDYSRKSPINVKQSKMMIARGGMGILMEAQYINLYRIGAYAERRAMLTDDRVQKFYRDSSPGDVIKYTTKGEGKTYMLIHRGYPGGTTVDNWSQGCQVFSSESELNKFFDLCEIHSKKYGNRFNYTLMLEKDL